MTRRRFVVAWTEVAARDLERLATYLLEDTTTARAEEILERIISRAQSLEVMPKRGRVPPELRTVGDRAWREVQEPPWRIVYRISGRTIQIHGVFDGRRDLADILMERLLDAC